MPRDTPREDNESSPLTPKQRTLSANQSVRNLDQEKPVSTPKQAFRTPRPDIADGPVTLMDDLEKSVVQDQGHEGDMSVAKDMGKDPPDVFEELKKVMSEENMVLQKQKTLESIRTALRSMSSERKFRDTQLERTVTILSIASQIVQESVELEVFDDFDNEFERLHGRESRALSNLSGHKSVKELRSQSRRRSKELGIPEDTHLVNIEFWKIEL